MSARKTLQAAADLLEKPGAWTQHTSARDVGGVTIPIKSDRAVCWCVIGALWRASVPSSFYSALREFKSAIGTDFVPEWNDHPSRKQAEVVAALRIAAARALLP